MLRQHTRELMSTKHTNPWLIPILASYVRLFGKKTTTSIRIFLLQSTTKVLSNSGHFVWTSSCSSYWTTPQIAPAVFISKPHSNTNTQCGAVSTLLTLRCAIQVTGNYLWLLILIVMITLNIRFNIQQLILQHYWQAMTRIWTWILRLEMLPQNLVWAKVYVKHWIAIGSKGDNRK